MAALKYDSEHIQRGHKWAHMNNEVRSLKISYIKPSVTPIEISMDKVCRFSSVALSFHRLTALS